MATLPVVAPEIQPGIDALSTFLCAEGYHDHARGIILAFVAEEGTLEGLTQDGSLEPADYAAAEEAFVRGLEPACVCDPAWDEHATEPGRAPRYYPWDAVVELPTLLAIPPELDADPDEFDRAWDLACMAHDEATARALEECPPYEPTEADTRAYAELMSEDFALREFPPVSGGAPDPEAEIADEMRAWYDAHPIGDFNRDRND
jgi:hypothetical protein